MVSHVVVSSACSGTWVGVDGPASKSGGGCEEPYRKMLLRRADRADVDGRGSSGQLAALAVSEVGTSVATSAVTSTRCAAGECVSWPASEPARAASEAARGSVCCEPADNDASPVIMWLIEYHSSVDT